MESLDYRYHTVHTNSSLARPNDDDDSSYTIIVSHEDPNSGGHFYGNWIETTGHECGTSEAIFPLTPHELLTACLTPDTPHPTFPPQPHPPHPAPHTCISHPTLHPIFHTPNTTPRTPHLISHSPTPHLITRTPRPTLHALPPLLQTQQPPLRSVLPLDRTADRRLAASKDRCVHP